MSAPSGPTRVRVVLTAAALSLVVGCIDLPGRPDDPQVPECLENAVFGAPEDSPYVLPYPPGNAYEVFQTYCGPVSHGKDGQMSIDFLTPLGSKVVAARAGIVRRVHDRDEDYGRDINAVFIEHDDGTAAFYDHLQQDSASVAVGDRVVAGQTIARSGASGTSLPHLHFGVAGSWPARVPDGVPVNFRNADGELDERGGLQAGAYYRAVPFDAAPAVPSESERP